jgi:hypothetical protein
MFMDKLVGLAIRAFFVVAFVLFAVAVFEVLANAIGYTLLRGLYSGGRMLELSALLLVFAIALLLRQIRDRLGDGSRTTA